MPAASTAPTVSLFGLRCPFLRPGPRIAPANARRASQDRALARPRGLGLYGTEHDGRLEEPGSIVLADICVNASCAVMAVAAPRSTSVTELSSHSTYGRFQIIGLREGQSPAWAETRPSRGSGAPPFAVPYGPTPRAFSAGARPNCPPQATQSTPNATWPQSHQSATTTHAVRDYFARGAENIGALFERAGMELELRSDICRRSALV